MIKSLAEYIEVTENLNIRNSNLSTTTLPWYRGQADKSWDLVPSILRGDWNPAREREMTRDFKLRALMEVDHKPSTYLDWLFIMQHYGLPTRLLDWTESRIVALYFAVENFNNRCDATVWIFHPWRLNEQAESYGHKSVPPVDDEIEEDYEYPIVTGSKIKKEFPLAVRPSHSSRRIVAQRGQFTIHGHNQDALNRISGLNLTFENIDISGNHKLKIMRELYKSGVSRYTLFPDIEGLAKEISCRYSNIFMR